MWSRTCGFTAYFIMKKRDDAPGGYGFKERLTLIRDGDAWLIVGIERLQDERHPRKEPMFRGRRGWGWKRAVHSLYERPRIRRWRTRGPAVTSVKPQMHMPTVGGIPGIRSLRNLTWIARIISPSASLQAKPQSTILVKEKRDGGTRGT